MSIPYFPNIPNPPNDPADDVNAMQTNSQSIYNIINVDHAPFNQSSPPGGQHKQVSFALNQSAPSQGAAGSGLYTNLVNAVSELFFQNSRSTTIQLTDLVVNSVGNGGSGGGSQFVIDTPWNIRILAGTTNAISSGSAKTVVYPNTFTTIYTAQATANDPNAHYASAQQISNSVLSIRTDALVQVSWLVIGRL